MIENDSMDNEAELQAIIIDFNKHMRQEKIHRILARTVVAAVFVASAAYVVIQIKNANDE